MDIRFILRIIGVIVLFGLVYSLFSGRWKKSSDILVERERERKRERERDRDYLREPFKMKGGAEETPLADGTPIPSSSDMVVDSVGTPEEPPEVPESPESSSFRMMMIGCLACLCCALAVEVGLIIYNYRSIKGESDRITGELASFVQQSAQVDQEYAQEEAKFTKTKADYEEVRAKIKAKKEAKVDIPQAERLELETKKQALEAEETRLKPLKRRKKQMDVAKGIVTDSPPVMMPMESGSMPMEQQPYYPITQQPYYPEIQGQWGAPPPSYQNSTVGSSYVSAEPQEWAPQPVAGSHMNKSVNKAYKNYNDALTKYRETQKDYAEAKNFRAQKELKFLETKMGRTPNAFDPTTGQLMMNKVPEDIKTKAKLHAKEQNETIIRRKFSKTLPDTIEKLKKARKNLLETFTEKEFREGIKGTSPAREQLKIYMNKEKANITKYDKELFGTIGENPLYGQNVSTLIPKNATPQNTTEPKKRLRNVRMSNFSPEELSKLQQNISNKDSEKKTWNEINTSLPQ